MKIKKLTNFLETYWQPTLAVLLSLALLCALLWFRLGSLPGGVNETEQQILGTLSSRELGLSGILENPVYLPYSLILLVIQSFGIANITALRFISTVIGILVAVSFFAVLKKWHTERVAVLGTVLFVLSGWFLHVARFGGPDIFLTTLLVFFFAGVWLQHSRHRSQLLALLLISACLMFYVPGMIWFVVLGGIWQRKRILGELAKVKSGVMAVYSVLALLFLSPLIWAIFNNTDVVKSILGFPAALPSVKEFLLNLVSIPKQLFISGPANPELWLSGLPLLDLFSMVMFIIGAYWYMNRFRLDRTMVLTVVLLIGSALIALGGPVTITLLLPFTYLIITAGITYMLSEWFTVFPRNPIARTIGTTLITVAVLLTGFYHLNLYYIAWPNAPQTREAYQQQQR